MTLPRSVSVLIPTWQGIEFLDRVLGALALQEGAPPWDLFVIDSGSTDGTWELCRAWQQRFPVPFQLERIDGVEFDHGDTRNLLAASSEGELIVFLTQDAIPSDRGWLAQLASNFEDPEVGAAYCRNVPRPGAGPLPRLFSAADPGYRRASEVVRLPEDYPTLDPHARRMLYNFNDVASALRRDVWERHPFPRTWFGEDVLMARALLEAGYAIAYDAEAPVEHSHDYDEHETYARAQIDGRFNAEWLGRVCVHDQAAVEILTERTSSEDAVAIGALGLSPEDEQALLERAGRLRRAAFQGLFDGGATLNRRPATRMLEDGRLSILFVVHGFPPDTWAGTEIYTLNLARELVRRGHRAVILTRAPAEGDEPDFTVREDEFEGLRVLRMTHRLAHARLSESFSQPRVEEVFRRLLSELTPDLVHFQHLIHTSIGLVQVAKDQGLPTVITCHDYWALCPRVQLIRPDGVRCPENMGSGCYLCVKEEKLPLVPLAQRVGRAGEGPLAGLADDLAAGACGDGVQRRAQEYLDLQARERDVPAAYAACDLRISPSRYLRSCYLETGLFDPHTFLYSDNGMRTDHVHALEKTPSDGCVRFGFVGSLVWYKGGQVLLEAMERLTDLPVVLRLHGDFRPEEDPHHAQLQAIAPDNVEFCGRFDNARLSEVYAEIDVLVVPSVWVENSPITIHEAWLTHTPVVASDIGGMAEYVRDGVDGLHFGVGDPDDLARVLRRCVEEPGLIEELSREFSPIKTIAQNAAETEFRYRALCSIERERGGARLDLAGHETVRREGPVELQGADLLLLRPGGAAVEYDLESMPAGPTSLTIEILALGAEPATEQGGRVLVAGVEVGRIPLFHAEGADELRPFEFEFDLPARARVRIETRIDDTDSEATLRVASIRAREGTQ